MRKEKMHWHTLAHLFWRLMKTGYARICAQGFPGAMENKVCQGVPAIEKNARIANGCHSWHNATVANKGHE
jgi:hypothetical protein